MSIRIFTGLLGAGVGLGLALLGLLLVLLCGARVLLALGRPDHARIARGLVAAGGVLALCGGLLYAAADAVVVDDPGFRHAVDQAALLAGGVALILATWAGIRTARRRPRPDAPAAPAEPPPPAAPQR